MLRLVPVDRGVVHVVPRELVEDQVRRKRRQLVERRPEWIDMVQHAARDNRVEGPGVVELLERHAPVEGPLGSMGVDADHVVARGRQHRERRRLRGRSPPRAGDLVAPATVRVRTP